MELSQYWRIMTRWFPLILAGTILAIIAGSVIMYKSQLTGSSTNYTASASVIVYSATPGGGYFPGVSTTDVENGLIAHVNDPGATQISPRLPGPSYSSLTATIDPISGTIKVQAVAPTQLDARTAVDRAARYLADIEISQVQAEAKQAIDNYLPLVSQTRKRWLHALRLRAQTPSSKRLRLSILEAKAGQLEGLLTQYENNITQLRYPALPAAAVIRAHKATSYQSKPLSPLKTVIPAAIIGFVASFLLAALLDLRQPPSAGKFAFPPKTSRERRPDRVQAQTQWVGQPPPVGQAVPEEPVVPVAQAAAVAPDEMASAPHLESPRDDRSEMITRLAEPMRQSAELISRLVDSSHPSIFVTSPTSAEPKSESAIGLAAAMALSGRRVVLVDADPAAAISDFFDLIFRPGLTDFLGYPEGRPQQLIYPANMSAADGSLWVMPHGIRRHTPALIGSYGNPEPEGEAWKSVLTQLASDGVLVIVDGPALADGSDRLASAGHAGGVIVTLERERTGPDVTQLYDVLRSHCARLLGVVANPTKLRLDRTDPTPEDRGFLGTAGRDSSIGEESANYPDEPRFPDMGFDPLSRS